MTADLVIGLDSSTQSTKAVAWDRTGRAVAEGRAAYGLSMPRQGWAEQDPGDWHRAALAALAAVAAAVDPARIAGIAVANQRETTAFLDAEGRPTRPAILWLDERGRSELPRLAGALGADALHALTGKPLDLTPALPKIAWVAREEPDVFARTAFVGEPHACLAGWLAGRRVASWSSADPSGLFDIRAKDWSAPVLAHLGLPRERLAALAPPGTRIGGLTAETAAATGLAEGTPLFAAGGDGQCAGLGVNAMAEGNVYLNLGTAMITGVWTAEPRLSRFWRTMCSPTGEGYFLESCQRAGAFLVNWVVDGFCGGRSDPGIFERLEREAAAIPLGSEGLLMSPYLTGAMDPHWDPSARAALAGLAPNHGPVHLYRAALEALVCESARAIAAMRAEGIAARRIVAVGGGAASALWTRMFADATGLPLARSRSLEATALGAGIVAAVGAGWFADFAAAAAAMTGEAETIAPDPAMAAAWADLVARQGAVYRPAPG